MERRLVVLTLATLILGGALGCVRTEEKKVYRVGILITDDTYLDSASGFKDGMKERGYREGDNITYDLKNANLNNKDLKRFAEQFAKDKVDLIFTATYIGALAAKEATAETGIPVVFGPAGDPVEMGLVKSIQNSGNNLTGVSTLSLELTGKRLEMLTKIAPKTRRIAIIYSPNYTFSKLVAKLTFEAAGKLGISVVERLGNAEGEIRKAAASINPREVDAIFGIPDILVNNQIAYIAEVAKKNRLPLMVHIRTLVLQGPLASYGINLYSIGKQSARLADKALKGVKPSDIPMETPHKFDLIINLKTAKAIGLKIPEPILGQADEIIR
ncbi:MAG: ABC transporter substrate-binding protein [candidate division NC10 bacterium]|nr:ABC transporter substrate-binding protein [candidate division NC10 bacterium]